MKSSNAILSLSLTLWCLFLSPSAYAIQCSSFIPTRTLTERIDQRQDDMSTARRKLEDSIHASQGVLSPNLEATLTNLFRNPEMSQPRLQHIRDQIKRDPIAKRLSTTSQDKLIWLVYKRYTRPYLAFLIVRYMDSIENRDVFSYETLVKMSEVTRSYIFERALLIYKRKLMTRPHKDSERDVLDYLNGREAYRTTGINYNSPSTHLILSNFFKDTLREVEDEIASAPDFSNYLR